jgi:anaerobic magnesium-protoporphyrin IX monomethyl ester cyclase
MFLMWGNDGEELKDIEASIGHVKHTRPDVILTTVVYPVKGTGYYDKVSDRIMSNTSWEKGSDRDLQVKGRPSRSFYQGVDRLLRSEVELARLLDGRDLPDASMVEALRSRIAEERSNVHTGWHAAENRQ